MQSERRKNTLFASFLLLGSLLLSAIAVSPVRAAGTLYVNPASITSQPIGGNITYQVKVANVDPFNGWDVMVRVNRTVLAPKILSITPNILAANFSVTVFELIHCVDGSGIGCTTADGPGIVHSAVVAFSTPPQTGPTSGLLFTIVYNVAAKGLSLVHIFNDIIANGTPTPVAHTTVDGVYGALLPKPDYSVAVQPALVVLNQGSSTTVTVTVTRIGNFSGTVGLKVATNLPFGVSSSFSVTSGTPTFTSVLTLTASATATLGTTTITVQAFNKTTTRTASFTLTVSPPPTPDFTIRTSSTFISLVAGSSGNTSIILTSINGFAGTVTLSSTVFPIVNSGPTPSVKPTTVTLTSGGTGGSQLTITTSLGTPTGGYNVTVSGSSGSLSHSAVLGLTVRPVPDFSIIVFPSSLIVPRGSSAQANIRLFSNSSFTGVVTLTSSVSPPGPTVSLSSSSVTLTPFSSAQLILTVTAGSFVPIGNYIVTVTGMSGSLFHSAVVSVQVTNPPLDFTISASPSFLSLPQGTTGTSVITLTSINNFSGTVNISAFSSPFGLPLSVASPVTLPSGGTISSTLTIPTTINTLTGNYTVTVIGSTSGLSHSTLLRVFVTPSMDKPPVANFTITPTSPVVGQTVLFNGSGSSDPDGSVVDWFWNFGDGFISFGTFTSHTYSTAGNFTVTLTVRDNAGLFASKSAVVPVRQKLAHDVAILSIEVFPKVAVSSQFVNIEVRLINNGLSNETVSLTAFYDSHVISTVNNIFLPVPNCRFFFCQIEVFVEVNWDTFGVAPGNYTISATVFLATDQHPADNSLSDGQVTILPPPVLTLTPSSGGLGTKVLVQGSGFPTQIQFFGGPTEVIVTFDDMFLGFVFVRNGSFTFTFDIPHAEPGVHLVKAFDTFSGARAVASFQVLPEQGTRSLAVSVDVGAVYFPGDTATIFILTSMNGVPTEPPGLQLQVSLFKPDGSMVTLNTTSIAPGLFKASFTVPKTGSLGTYAILASGHTPDSLNASSLGSFEVKPSWLNGQGQTVMTAAAIAGVAGVLALAWRRGYLRRRNEEFPSPSF